MRAFCGLHGLSQANFYAWRREIQQRDAAAEAFLPVEILPQEDPPSTSRLEVVVAGGRTLRVAPGFDPVTLRQLLAVLEEVRVC